MKESVKRSFWFNLLMVLSIATGLYIIFFASLSFFTHHGEKVLIPNLRGKSMSEAIDQLHNMHFEVKVDSMFEPGLKPLTVLKQIPDTGSIVKTGRIVMITVNSVRPMVIPMPNLVGMSYRSALLLLKNNKLFVGETIYVPDIAEGAIKEQHYNGQVIKPGEMLPQASKVDLVVGNGLGNSDVDVPNVVGMTYDEALSIINANNLIPFPSPSPYDADVITDTATAVIISQSPSAFKGGAGSERNKIKQGEVIDLYIKQHPVPEDFDADSKRNMQDTSNVKKEKTPKKNLDEDN